MRAALEKVVLPGGTATRAAVPGFRTAGKTGTVQKHNPKGGYMPNSYIVSFAGMMPAQDPAFVCVVVIDDPRTQKVNRYGGTIAAPVFGKIAARVASRMNLQPTEPIPPSACRRRPMILRDLVSSLSRVTVAGSLDAEVRGITASSREVAPGMIFAAIRGTTLDGHRFINDALAAGATAILAESAPPSDYTAPAVWLHVPDSRAAVAALASTLAGHPWQDLSMAGITGTNGKTTTAFLLHHLMKSAWHRAGLLGTILVDDGETVEPAKHTTPGSIELCAVLGRMRDNGCRGVAMEVSSHGIHQKRISSIGFDACVFTNLTQDHLDYHGTLEAYFKAKAEWFLDLAANPLGKKPVAVINTRRRPRRGARHDRSMARCRCSDSVSAFTVISARTISARTRGAWNSNSRPRGRPSESARR